MAEVLVVRIVVLMGWMLRVEIVVLEDCFEIWLLFIVGDVF